MPKILVIHGAGMNMRGKVQLDVFGPMTLPEYDERIRGYAKELGVEGEIVNKLYARTTRASMPRSSTRGVRQRLPALVAALSQSSSHDRVHPNPIRRGPASRPPR